MSQVPRDETEEGESMEATLKRFLVYSKVLSTTISIFLKKSHERIEF